MNFDAERALPGSRQALRGIQHGADARAQSQALQPGRSQDDGGIVATIELGQARIQIAAQGLDPQLRVARAQHRLATQAGGAYHAARR